MSCASLVVPIFVWMALTLGLMAVVLGLLVRLSKCFPTFSTKVTGAPANVPRPQSLL